MDKGKNVEEDKPKEEEEERRRNSSSVGLIIGNSDDVMKEGEQEDENEVESAMDMTSLGYTLPTQKAEDGASTKKRKFIGNPFSCFGGASSKLKSNSDNTASSAIPPPLGQVPLHWRPPGRSRLSRESSSSTSLDRTSLNSALPSQKADGGENTIKHKFEVPPSHKFSSGLKSSKGNDAEGSSGTKGSRSDNPALSTTQPQHPRQNLSRFITRGRFLVECFGPFGGVGNSEQNSDENPASSASQPVSSSLNHESSSSPMRMLRSFTAGRFRVEDSEPTAAAARGGNRGTNSSSTDLQSEASAADVADGSDSNEGMEGSPEEPQS